MKPDLRNYAARGAFILLAGSVVAALGSGCASGVGGAGSPAATPGAGESASATGPGGGPLQGRIYEEWFDPSAVVLPPPPAR